MRAKFIEQDRLSITLDAELERPRSAQSAVQNALVAFAERNDLCSAEGCMGLNAISEFGERDAEITQITRTAARALRQVLMGVLTKAKSQGELSRDADTSASQYRSLSNKSVPGTRWLSFLMTSKPSVIVREELPTI